MKVAAALTHGRPEMLREPLAALQDAADAAGVELRVDPKEVVSDGGKAPAEQIDIADPLRDDVEICFALGGDGTILRALRRYAGTQVPVYAVNFGAIGFLATIEPDEMHAGFAAAFNRDFDVLALPAITFEGPNSTFTAMNDVSLHRLPDQRIAELGYIVEGAEIGNVRCDGLVAATPVGSTGYNLANGGPLLAWGVEGYVVTFIAPHSLTARPLVIAPGDTLQIINRSLAGVEIAVDGRPIGELLPSGETLSVHWVSEAGHLAQQPGSSFYERARDRFGRLAS